MSAERIDVLTVIDSAIGYIESIDEQRDGELREARAAVAELIEAVKDDQAQQCGNFAAKSCGCGFYCVCPGDRLRAALARVQGGAA